MYERYACEQINSPDGRHYLPPDHGDYPSVTNILKVLSEDEIARWKLRVGEQKAQYIQEQATKIGTEYHRLIEFFLRNGVTDKTGLLFAKAHFENIMDSGALFDITNIRGLEHPLWSHDLRAAGTCDCIADYRGVPSIIDFKTSEKKKKPEYIKGYYMQAAAYSHMVKEIYDESLPQLVIMISGADNTFEVFKQDYKDWIQPFKSVRNIYDIQQGLL